MGLFPFFMKLYVLIYSCLDFCSENVYTENKVYYIFARPYPASVPFNVGYIL